MARTPDPNPAILSLADHAPAAACWGIHDGAAGSARQVRGLCESLAAGSPLFPCKLRWPYSLLNSSWKLAGAFSFADALPPPRLAVTCGRHAAVAGLGLQQRFRERVTLIHLQDPRFRRSRFDWIIAPEQDRPPGGNVIPSLGTLHPFSPAVLAAAARSEPCAGLGNLGPGFVTVLLGGPGRGLRFAPADIAGLIARLQRVAATGRRLAIIPSLRTPPHALRACRQAFPSEFLWNGETENPYPSALALGAATIVTSDSESMITEATATGRPVYVEFLPASRWPEKRRRFHELMLDRGYVRPFVGRIDDWTYEPLFEAERIAALLRERLAEQRSRRAA